MSWSQKDTRDTNQPNADESAFPVHFELVPGKLSARVYLHEIESQQGPVPCWSYVTDGLWAHGQKELIFTLRRDRGEEASDFPDAPLNFFAAVYGFAARGQLVDAGDISQLGGADFLGYKSLAYMHPQSFKDLPVSSPALAAILLTEEELDAVREFGITRVMARLGQAYHYYPCPPWSDRTRSGLPLMRRMQESLLVRTQRIRAPGVRVRLEENQILLRLLPQAGPHLRSELEQVPSNAPLSLLTELDPRANGCLVWEPGQSGPVAITPPNSDGSRLTGCFMAFVPGQAEDGGQLFEDGFVMMLTDESWTTIRQALETGKAVSVPATKTGLSFSLEWIAEEYENPIDGLVYHAEGGWETYSPEGARGKESEGPVDVKKVTLLTRQSDLETRVGTQPLVAYIEAIKGAVQDHFATLAQGPGQDLSVQFEVQPEGAVELKMASRPGIADEILQGLHSHLLTLPAPQVNRGPIAFQILFAIWGGCGTS